MLQHDQPDDFIVASGQLHRVEDFVELAFDHVGLDWRQHVREQGALHRPVHTGVYHGDVSKIRATLGWKPTTDLKTLVAAMVDHHLRRL
jgi:GDPmannose 4,6-dehydratase